MNEKQNKFLRHALAYAEKLNWPVFPCKPRSKEPLTAHGFKDATRDPKIIKEWWAKWPDANIATPTGIDHWVLDKDVPEGELSLMALVAKHGKLAATLQQITGGGGEQYFYQLGDEMRMACHTAVWPGIDVKGEGGYVVLPPSIHPETGREYVWDSAKKSILEEPINPANPWLVEEIETAVNGEKKPGGTPAEPWELPPTLRKKDKQRHPWLKKMAASMSAKGMNYNELVATLDAINHERCEPPYDYGHIAELARYYAQKDRERNERPPGEPRPLVLPEPDSVDQILDADIALPEPLIEELFPRRGLCLMTGAQRSGKTIFAAQTAISLATNQALLGNYRLLAHGPVIVFEKDDPGGMASFKEIYIKSKVKRGTPIDYYGKEKIPVPLGQAFLEWLEVIIPKRGAVAVVLDSYTALRPDRVNGGDIVRIEREDIAGLDELGKRLNCLILLLHHESITTRSNGTLEWDARGAGTYGMSMAAECQMAITRFRDLDIDSPERLVRFRSRHMKEHQAVLFYNPETGLYEHMFDGRAASYYPLIHDIKRHIHEETFTAKDVEEALAVARATAFRTLGMLKARGILWHAKESGGYRFSPEMEAVKLPPL